MSKTFEVIVPMYGYMTLEVEGETSEEAEELALSDCMNVFVDRSDMEYCDDNFMLSPYDKISQGNTSYVEHTSVKSVEI